jgi:hypothetical protein
LLGDLLPPGVPAPTRSLSAEPCSGAIPLDELVPTLVGRPRREVLEEMGTAIRATGGEWKGAQHDPDSAVRAGGEASKLAQSEWPWGSGAAAAMEEHPSVVAC